jgi:hypothetical protein
MSTQIRTLSVWGHHNPLLNSEAPTLDGKKILSVDGNNGAYTQFGENQGDHQATIGLIVHELGHDLDLPDLYDVDPSNGETNGVGDYSVMGRGSWASLLGEEPGDTPVHFDAWSKVFLGFETTIEIPLGPDTVVTLNAIDTTNPTSLSQYNIYKVLTMNPDEYFLLENRQQGASSGFDQGLSVYTYSSGIAIWHIDSGIISEYYGAINDLFPKGIDLESYDHFTGDPFYHDGYRFDMLSTPDSSYNEFIGGSFPIEIHKPSAISIFTNSPSSSIMTVSVGVSPTSTAAPIAYSSNNSISYLSQWPEAVDVYYLILPKGTNSPNINHILQGTDYLGKPVALSGYSPVAAGTLNTITVNGLTASTDYTFYSVSKDMAGHRGTPSNFDLPTSSSTNIALTVGSSLINEAATNDGSISATQTITVTNATYGGFNPIIAAADITVNHLPAGLNYTIVRTSDTMLTLIFTGQATNHANADDVNHISVTIPQSMIAGATDEVTSNPFAINYMDPSSLLTYLYNDG